MLSLSFHQSIEHRQALSTRCAIICSLCEQEIAAAFDASCYGAEDVPIIVKLGYCPQCFTPIDKLLKKDRGRIYRLACAKASRRDERGGRLPRFRQGLTGVPTNNGPRLWRPDAGRW